MSYLYLAFHYPKTEYRQELLNAMHQLNNVMQAEAGLQMIGAWAEESGERIIALSIWESRQTFQAALGRIGASVAGVPFDKWEAQPRQLIRAEEITFHA